MTQEQRERSAYNMSFEESQEYISKCGFNIPWNDGDVFVDERELTRTLGNVLKWRIDSVWHLSKETPKDGNMIICITSTGPFIAGPDVSGWHMAVEDFNITRWAYVSDLIPTEE